MGHPKTFALLTLRYASAAMSSGGPCLCLILPPISVASTPDGESGGESSVTITICGSSSTMVALCHNHSATYDIRTVSCSCECLVRIKLLY